MISPAGWFDYDVAVERTDHGWSGVAAADPARRGHPGIAGPCPRFELSNGVVTLYRTAIAPIEQEEFWTPDSHVSFDAGECLGAIMQAGDALHLSRGGCGEIAFVVTRQDALVLVMGGAGRWPHPSLTLTEDPRAHEISLYGAARLLDDPSCTFVWLDISDPNLEGQLTGIDTLAGERLLIAVAGGNDEQRSALNRRLMWPPPRLHGRRSIQYQSVPGKFTSSLDWVAYLRGLPKERPADLHLRFDIADRSITLLEGGYEFEPPWHFYVERVYTPGLPGNPSRLAVVRADAAITREMVIRSAQQVANSRIRLPEDHRPQRPLPTD